MTKPAIGRPRSEKSRQAIIEATDALLAEGDGAGLTVEAVARRAGVGKPTIYRWWPTLADLVLDVLLRQAEAAIPVVRYRSLRETLRGFVRLSVRAITDGAGPHLRFLMAQAQQDEPFRERFRERFTTQRRAVLKSVFQQDVVPGGARGERHLDVLADIVFGAMWYRLLAGHAPLNESFADDLTDAAMAVVETTRPAKGRARRPHKPGVA